MWLWNSDEKKEERIQELEEKLEEAREEKESWKNRFEAEKERRSTYSKEKQEAEERINRLEDKLEGLKSGEEKEEIEEEDNSKKDLGFNEARRVVSKLSSVESSEKDLVTVYHTGDIDDIDDLRGLKNSIGKAQFNSISDPGIYLFDEDHVLDLFLSCRPFFDSEWVSGDGFSLGQVSDFIEEGKVWVKVSAGDSKVFRESSGDLELVENVKDRVNRQHRSGGFSQGRFERKRDEQIEGHLDNLCEVLPEEEQVFLVGEQGLCEEVPGEYLGGFDPNRSDLEAVYGFGFRRL